MARPGYAIDRATQAWVRATGKKVAFEAHPWLLGPTGDPELIADEWLPAEARRLRGTVVDGGGLIARMTELASDVFDPAQLAPPIVEFYERTAQWRLEVWSQWSPAAWPFGWLLSTLFANRLRQLALPLRPLDSAQGMDSRVVVVKDSEGVQLGAAWLRTLRSTGQTVYSGWYGVAVVPNHVSPSVRVVFPLPNGSIAVFLRPEVGPDGSLVLVSPLGVFGDDGAYLIVTEADGHQGWVRRVALDERFVVWVDTEGVLRTDHALKFWRVPIVRLHYKIERRRAT